MTYEEETEYNTSHYRCIDPIENLKIRVVLQPVKNLHISIPLFEKDGTALEVFPYTGENQSDSEEYTFKWQEKKFSKHEVKKYLNEPDWKRKLAEKYYEGVTDELNNLSNHSSKLFSYVEADGYSADESDINIYNRKMNYVSPLSKKITKLRSSEQNSKNYKNISKRKIIEYSPSEDFKNHNHLLSHNIQKMFLMIDLGVKVKGSKKSEKEEINEAVLCVLSYDFSNNTLQVTPGFSESKLKPYTIGMESQDSRSSYHYWVYHASTTIPVEDLTKEIKIMSKVFDHQENLRKLQLDTDFLTGKPNHLCVTLLGEITKAQDFEYDHLHIHYFIKLPCGWEYNGHEALMGRTQTSFKNSYGVCYFSHLFEMNFVVGLNTLEESISDSPELFFEVLSVDNYKRYRNEGYTYVSVPKYPGIHTFSLTCWRALDKTIRSQLKRFFIGGGPELEDVSYVGISSADNAEVISRFGFETAPSGKIDIKLNVLHQSDVFKSKKNEEIEAERNILNRLDAGSLLGSLNTVLEAFRKARERMLQARKGLETDLNFSFPKIENDFEKKVTIKDTKVSK